jgi:hypothetical protein
MMDSGVLIWEMMTSELQKGWRLQANPPEMTTSEFSTLPVQAWNIQIN